MPIATVTLPTGQTVPPARARHLDDGRRPPQPRRRGPRAAGRHRSRHDAHRHRRDVRERRRRGDHRRGRSMAGATRCSSSQRSCPSNASRQGTDRRLRAQPQAARHGDDRPLPPPLARQPPARPTPSPASRRCSTAGKIRAWGVSNFDVDDMEELLRRRRRGGRHQPGALQSHPPRHRARPPAVVGRSTASRSWPIRRSSRAASPATARSPASPRPAAQRRRRSPSPSSCRHPNVISIPKSGTSEHIRENRKAADIVLTADELAALDEAFPPPRGPKPLEMI